MKSISKLAAISCAGAILLSTTALAVSASGSEDWPISGGFAKILDSEGIEYELTKDEETGELLYLLLDGPIDQIDKAIAENNAKIEATLTTFPLPQLEKKYGFSSEHKGTWTSDVIRLDSELDISLEVLEKYIATENKTVEKTAHVHDLAYYSLKTSDGKTANYSACRFCGSWTQVTSNFPSQSNTVLP